MKYLITDTQDHTLGEINDYFKSELIQTSLLKEDIVIEDKLKVKLGMLELSRIFDENGMANSYELGLGMIHMKHTGHSIEFTDNEIHSRFEDAYKCILYGLKDL